MVVSLCTVPMVAERMQCVPSEAVCSFLLMFWMAVFHTHQSQTGVPIAEECTVYLLNKLSSQLQVAEAPHCLTGVLTPPQDETFGNSTLLRSRPGSALFKSLFCLTFVSRPSSFPPSHCGSISSSFFFLQLDCFITGSAFVSNLFYWSHLKSLICKSLCKTCLLDKIQTINHLFRAGSHHHLIFPNFLLTG